MNIYSKDLHRASGNLFSDKTSDEIQTVAPDALGDDDDSTHHTPQSEPPKTVEDGGGRDFSWRHAEEDGDLVQHSTQAVACYINTQSQIVIRSEAAWNDGEDRVIIVAPTNLRRLVNRLIELGDHIPINSSADE